MEIETEQHSHHDFPANFLWGVATSSHQMEGGTNNQWSEWEKHGRIKSGDAVGLACDWWNNAEKDFDLANPWA